MIGAPGQKREQSRCFSPSPPPASPMHISMYGNALRKASYPVADSRELTSRSAR